MAALNAREALNNLLYQFINLFAAWLKWIADASGTKTQYGLIAMGSVVAMVYKGLTLAKSVPEVTALISAMIPVLGILIAAWGGIKYAEMKTNGGTIPK